MLGYSALGTAALGTDGGTYLEAAVVGASTTGLAGVLSGDHASVQLTPAIGTSAVGTFSSSQSLGLGAALSSGAAGNVIAVLESLAQSACATAAIGSIALSLAGQPSGIAAVGALGQLAQVLTTAFSGVESLMSVATLVPGVAVTVGTFPITSDGVLGLWTLGDAALGVDAPAATLFSGVAGNGVCSPMTMFVDNSVVSITAAAPIAADPGASLSGVAIAGQVGSLASILTLSLPGVAATCASAMLPGSLIVAFGPASAAGVVSPFGFGVILPMAGVIAATEFGTGSLRDPSQTLSGCVATAAPGTFLSHSPSSAFALWGTPVPGGSATVAFGGLPSVALTIATGQTTAQIASSLSALINANSTLVTAGISARTIANLVELHQPQPAVISSSVSMIGT